MPHISEKTGRQLRWAALPLILLLYVWLQAWPAYQEVSTATHGADYASFHYASPVAAEGGDPYDASALSKMAYEDGTRPSVFPYFYPPPALLAFLWCRPLDLQTGALVWFFLNQLALLASFLLLQRWLGASWIQLALLFALCTPIGDCTMMGQVNVMVLMLIAWALQTRNGAPLAAAAMIKMSPALLLWPMALWRHWRFVGMSVVVAVGLSLLALPILGLGQQLDFYLTVLPQFSSGDYSGLTVPVNLIANHSLPELFAQAFPPVGDEPISSQARTAAAATNGALFLLLSFVAWRRRESQAIVGAFVVLMVLVPIYTFEHHLVFLLLPSAIVLRESRGRERWYLALVYSTLFFLFWPLTWWWKAQVELAELQWWIQESKCFSAILLMFLLVDSAWSSAADDAASPDGQDGDELHLRDDIRQRLGHGGMDRVQE